MGNRTERGKGTQSQPVSRSDVCWAGGTLCRGLSWLPSSHCLGRWAGEMPRATGTHQQGESCACLQRRKNWKHFVKMAKGSLLSAEFCHSCYWQVEDKDGCLWMANSSSPKKLECQTELNLVLCPALNNLHPQISIRAIFLCEMLNRWWRGFYPFIQQRLYCQLMYFTTCYITFTGHLLDLK